MDSLKVYLISFDRRRPCSFFRNNHIAAFETEAGLIPQMLQSKQILKQSELYYIGGLCTHHIRD